MARTNQILQNPVTGQTIRFVQTARETGGRLLEMEALLRPHSSEPAAHFHPQQDEDFVVLSGELTVWLNGQLQTLQAGERLHVPRNTVHSMWNDSESETVVNWQVRPALDTEQLFETMVGLVNDRKVNAKGQPSLLQAVLLAGHFRNVYRLANPSQRIQTVIFWLLTPIALLVGYRPIYVKYLR